MAKSDIVDWAVSASAIDVDNDNESEDFWRKERVLANWDDALQYAQRKLMTGSTKVRKYFLLQQLLPLIKQRDFSVTQTIEIFHLFTQVYSRYTDTGSRHAIEVAVVEMVSQDVESKKNAGVVDKILAWLANETTRISKRSITGSFSSSDIYVLLTWCCGSYTACLKSDPDFQADRLWSTLVGVMAVLFDSLLHGVAPTKDSLRKTAVSRTRRTLRSVPDKLPFVIATLASQAKSSSTPLVYLPLIGTSIDVTLRLKNQKDEASTKLTVDTKASILSLYTTSVLMSKFPVPSHDSKALHDFVRNCVSEDDFVSTILPTIEKAILRSPELSLNVVRDFFEAYPHALASDVFKRLLSSALGCAKSTNPLVRLGTVKLFDTIIQKIDSNEEDVQFATNEVLALPKTSKTAGPDHRSALYSMLGHIPPTSLTSSVIVQNLPSLILKETHEAATSALVASLIPHVVYQLRQDQPIAEDITALLTKEMTSTKPALRRAIFSVVGDVLWSLASLETPAATAFAKGVLPALESNLKTITSNPLSVGPLEGYIAIALLLGPYYRSGKYEDFIRGNVSIQSLSSASPKPSFLLLDKVYQKLTEADDEIWLLRAGEVALSFLHKELAKNSQLRVQMGMLFLHIGVESKSYDLRRQVVRSLEDSSASFPELVNGVVIDSMVTFLARDIKTLAPKLHEDAEPAADHQSRLSTILLACASFGEDTASDVKKTLLVNLVVLAHHRYICGNSRQLWIEVCQKANVDPQDLVNSKAEDLLRMVMDATNMGHDALLFEEAGYRAVTTLAFVCPNVVLPRIVSEVRSDLATNEASSLSLMDLAIWRTAEGTPYIDVLASKQPETVDTKGKDYATAKWEAELRKTLKNKKPAASSLSKQDQALIQEQLRKESAIRQRVALTKKRLEHGLELIRSLASAQVDEFRLYLSNLAALLLTGGFGQASQLIGFKSFDVFIGLAECCSERLELYRKWLAVATLRALNVEGIPEDMQAEALNQLVLRVLYRFRTASEQAPFDAATFSWCSPLLTQVLLSGGIAVAEADEPLEQMVLVLDIIKFHTGEFSNLAFPRSQIMESLIHVIKQQPKLAKEASSSLVDIGQAIHGNVTADELNTLFGGTLVQEIYARTSCLQTLQPFDLTDLDWSPELWIASHDEDEQNARLAEHLWEDNGLDVPESFLHILLPFLEHDNAYVRSSSAAALAAAVEPWPQSIGATLTTLEEFYREKAKILAPEFDQYGMVLQNSLDRADPWAARVAVSRTFELLASAFTTDEVEPFFKFLIVEEALGDRQPEVRRGMLSAGTAVIDHHGASCIPGLISMFEVQLASSASTETSDQIKEAVVILFGRLGRHLDPSDSRMPATVERLIEALSTPAEQVQIAVSDCLAPLVNKMTSPISQLVDRLMEDLTHAPKYAARRGAAYGLAGVIKGVGILGMKQYNILERLKASIEDKTSYSSRQGAVMAFETLSATLHRIFEPYVMHILPQLLAVFGDATPEVREAAQDAARVIMGNMSGYGVKLILPDLLSGLDEKQWRTKKGSIELLGMMAYCAPRQLSQSLPIVIPRLTGVLTDSHAQVKSAANKSLKQFGEVISNPEIQALVPVFLKALVDPARTPNALSALLKTSFMHYIDHSSLALVIPILERGLRERGAETKRKAAQIVGNLASLTESKDFVPYLSRLLPMVHIVLVDPVPEARATAAKALGTLVERLGEINFPDLVPSLLRTLKTDTSGVDRQGAAQGLSEVLAGLGMERLEGLLPDIIANAQSPRSTVKEGFMTLLVFLPATFGTRFQPHLPKIIAPILSGLADSEDYVRDAAMRAGRMIVTNYASKAIDLLLPELERGMFDSGWRIRQSSITLVGELLFKITGVSGKNEIEDTAEVVFADSRRALVEVLGKERRDRILSALYTARQDAVNVVRQSSVHIWKALVQNTPRTVREILPELLNQLITLISSDEDDQQETASRTTAELCKKAGEKILGEIIAILLEKSASPDASTRAGVCLLLSELMESTNEVQRENQEDDIVKIVRTSLVDEMAIVRSAAAKAFDVLQEQLGPKAIDQTIPTLLEALRQPGAGSGTALQALTEVMNVRATTVFPVLIPTLIASPMTIFNAHALASLVTVAGTALSKRLPVLLNALVKESETVQKSEDEELKSAIEEAIEALLTSIDDSEGLNTLMLLLLGWSKNEIPVRRISACQMFATFCEVTELDSSLYRVDWIRQLTSLMDDRVPEVNITALHALDIFVKSVPKDELEPLVVPLRRTVESTGAPGTFVPGFSLPKGIAPMVPIIIAGLTTGSNEQREQAAYAISDLVERTEEAAIKPFVVPFTGPLIRVATQATTYPPAVKTAILTALSTMLERIPIFVKPFFPQLQRTFVKSASDPASAVVRNKAAHALGVLMRSQTRVDPVVTELVTGIKNSEDGISTSLLLALANVVHSAGANVGEKSKEACVELVSDAFRERHDEPYHLSVAALFTSLTPYPELLEPIVKAHLVAGTPLTVLGSQITLAALTPPEDGEADAPNVFDKLSLLRNVARKVLESVASDKPSISRPARESRELLKTLREDELQGVF